MFVSIFGTLGQLIYLTSQQHDVDCEIPCAGLVISQKNKGNSQKMLIKYGLFLTRTRATKADGHVKYGQAFKEIGQCVWTKHLYAKLISIA